ncbi:MULTISPECIES: hypothetical protein [Rhizobium]|uniref:Uncharacterized protein n=1 Tax=Rhizobium rhododendri TaxID=2506430 RepID=A0ABY8IPH2_9HYPH|nr:MULTISPECIES: hypothetical protein [Rhizobium]MBZ5762962.1 hypothetical protein [Rhizobium sp. VS19-DR96]MBZ5768795.1 hypothetical protein [Rhizobium sp. VS19-DR129.2]MBZ5776411.1 hypothetical protein [Rhizobium sp. VS19-DRK62.2]MBZ5787618.1 hypothetical protein [Rhizobium sp. VS19-DR121]MBZ5804973.1 hypothetical protein [Rhizobium sp. VS19-DR181]
MSVEPIGIATILIGFYCLLRGSNTTIIAAAIASIFGASAAMLVGAANIQPGHVILGFLALGVMTRREEARALVQALRPSEPGFWLAGLVIYGLISAYFLPRLLEGATQIVPLGSTVYGETRSTVPLTTVSSNLTQSVYMVGNFICFTITVAVASTHRGFNSLVAGLLACSVLIVVFAFLDIATFSTGTQAVLSFMRNARYTLHTDEQVAGVKRIVGSFTETSSFARTALGTFAFCTTLWLCGRRPFLTGLTGLISLILVVLSTSSTGLAGAPVILVLLYVTALSLSGRQKTRSLTTAAIIFLPIIMLAVCLWVAIDPVLSKIVYNYADLVVLGKASTDSGIERNSWNALGIKNFVDSYYLGVGLGTARTSSLLLALLSNVGLPGLFFYCAFTYGALLKRRGLPGSFTADVRLSARNGCLGLMFGDLLVSSAIDQGLFFYLLAALATAEPERATRTAAIPYPFLGVKS